MKMVNDYDVVIAVDIGLSGGIVFFDTVSGEILSAVEMPTEKITTKSGKEKKVVNLARLRHILEVPKEHKERALLVMENVHAFPGQGTVAIGTLMEQKGIISGMATALGYEVVTVEPKTWQAWYGMLPPKELKGATATKTKTMRKKWLKEQSVTMAGDLFSEWRDTKLALTDAHGISDAMLIGNWLLEAWQGVE